MSLLNQWKRMKTSALKVTGKAYWMFSFYMEIRQWWISVGALLQSAGLCFPRENESVRNCNAHWEYFTVFCLFLKPGKQIYCNGNLKSSMRHLRSKEGEGPHICSMITRMALTWVLVPDLAENLGRIPDRTLKSTKSGDQNKYATESPNLDN